MTKSNFEKIVEVPAIALEEVVEAGEKVADRLSHNKSVDKGKEFWHTLGPGLTTGASDDDPSGIATYSQAGAKYNYTFLWLAPLTFPLMAVIQEMCARIGIVTGRGLAANIRIHYPRWVIVLTAILLFVANVFNIGADLGALAEATRLLLPSVNFFFLVIFFTIFCLTLQIFVPYREYARYLKWLAIILGSYIITAFTIDLDWTTILKFTLTPHFPTTLDEVFLVCGILGTTISPYLFFWQTSQEVEEVIAAGGAETIKLRQQKVGTTEIGRMRLDVWSGMLFSNLAMFFIIVVCAATLYQAGVRNVGTAAQAAAALRPLAGNQAYLLFTIGILGVGLLGIPVLAGSASYALAEAFRFKTGLYRKLREAYAFYGIIIIAMLIGLGLNFLHIDPIKMLIYAAVLNGIVAPILLTPIIQISSNKKIMGKWASNRWMKTFGWVTVIFMGVVGLAAIWSILVPVL
jgi:NRAMP (natural resistance-associated macrophage protein)-like metal ion transporter